MLFHCLHARNTTHTCIQHTDSQRPDQKALVRPKHIAQRRSLGCGICAPISVLQLRCFNQAFRQVQELPRAKKNRRRNTPKAGRCKKTLTRATAPNRCWDVQENLLSDYPSEQPLSCVCPMPKSLISRHGCCPLLMLPTYLHSKLDRYHQPLSSSYTLICS